MANTGHMDDDQPNGRTRADLFGTPGGTLKLREAGDGAQGGAGDDASDAEARMRQALGLFGSKPGQAAERATHHEPHGGTDRRPTGGNSGGPGARRHRFVQDGEVPVSVVRGRLGQQRPSGSDTDRQAEELAHERQLRTDAERKLADKDIQLRSLQTRIGHAELERDNAAAEMREWREKALAAAAAAAQNVAPVPVPKASVTRAPDSKASDADAAERETAETGALETGADETSDVDVKTSEAEFAGTVGTSEVDIDETQGLPATQRGRRGPRRRAEEPQLDFVDPEPVKWWL